MDIPSLEETMCGLKYMQNQFILISNNDECTRNKAKICISSYIHIM